MIADAQLAAEIVNRIRSLSKKSKPERLVFDLNQMLEDVLALIRGEIVRQRVSLRLNSRAGCPPFRVIAFSCSRWSSIWS